MHATAQTKKTAVCVAAIMLTAFVLLGRQLLVPGVYSCLREDTIYYLNWTRQFADSLASGIIYPRWMAESHGGFGNPAFIFYPPLTVYLSALAMLATGSIITAATMVKFSGLALSGITMFVFTRDLWGNKAGLAASLMYMALPFRIYDMYFLGVHASKFAYVWFPLVLHFAGKAAAEDKAGRNTVWLAVCYAGLCVTHLLSAYMITPVAAAFAISRAERGGFARAVFRMAAGTGLGMFVAAPYLLPVLLEKHLVHFEMLLSDEIYNYRNNFLFYVQEAVPPLNRWFYGYMGLTVMSSFAAGVAAVIMAIPSGAGRRKGVVFFSAVTVSTVFLMSSLSALLWEYIPGMKMLQFPTRWASVAVFALACLAGAGLGSLDLSTIRKRPLYFGLAAPLLVVCFLWAGYYDYDSITRGCRFTGRDVAGLPKDMDVYEYVPGTVSLEWLKDHEKLQKIPLASSLYAEIPATININRWDYRERLLSVETSSETIVSIKSFYYPGWVAYLDGARTDIDVQPVTGAMLVSVPEGKHKISFRFEDTPGRLSGKAISALAILLAAALLWRGYISSHRKEAGADKR